MTLDTVGNVFNLPHCKPSLPKEEGAVSLRRLREISQGCHEEGVYCKLCGDSIQLCKCWNSENRARAIIAAQKLLVEIPEEI